MLSVPAVAVMPGRDGVDALRAQLARTRTLLEIRTSPSGPEWTAVSPDLPFDWERARPLAGAKQFFFAPREALLTWNADAAALAEPEAPPVALVGVHACDLTAIAYQDRFFADDPWYRQRRSQAFFVGIDCMAACAGGFCREVDAGPFARGGSGRFARALAAHFLDLGGEAVVRRRVGSLRDLPRARAVLFDVTPRQLAAIAGEALPAGYRRRLERYRYGPGVFKLDWALDGPIPWGASECARAGTVHVRGTFDEVAAAERAPWEGELSERPFLLVSQQSLFDRSRAPAGKHTAWGYCHVPHGSSADMTERIEAQMERFAPGFRARILARHAMGPADLERRNENLVGGDITGGVMDFRQLLARPAARLVPYATPARHLFICSASTPPGGGVHGMCGYWAARAALRSALRE